MLSVVVYSVIGFAVFGVAFFIMTKISPISIAKEIEEDQRSMEHNKEYVEDMVDHFLHCLSNARVNKRPLKQS